MKTGLFFGSFNPIHIGHLVIANYIVEFTDIQQLWFVVSPHNPLKEKNTLLDDRFRLEMVKLAIDGDERFEVTDVEFGLPQPSYTIDTLNYLTRKYPEREFVIIMGTDGLPTFDKWKNYTEIIDKYCRYIYSRPLDEPIDYTQHQNIRLIKAPQMEISSTFIREAIAQHHDVRHFLPANVHKAIFESGYYK
jgi:nicotinate-nucleotide adenylyltransferase